MMSTPLERSPNVSFGIRPHEAAVPFERGLQSPARVALPSEGPLLPGELGLKEVFKVPIRREPYDLGIVF
jgi:hypothetical protein